MPLIIDSLERPGFLNYNPNNQLPTSITEKWLYTMKDVESPLNFIVFAFFSMIGAALQRRVWLPQGNVVCYPNMFMLLTADPGQGKGRSIGPIKDIMKTMKLDNKDITDDEMNSGIERNRLLIPIPSDSITPRELTKQIAASNRAITFDDQGKKRIYVHCSMYFLLEELSDLIKTKDESKDVIRFLNRIWDNTDYDHSTSSCGADKIKNPCVSLLACATPKFLNSIFEASLLDEGFSARTFFVYAPASRFRKWTCDPPTPTQSAYLQDVVKHLKRLACLYGPLSLTPEANEFMRGWYEDEAALSRRNKSRKLDPFFGRLKVHVLKLAMAVHFSESLDFTLTLSDFKTALYLIDSVQESMHLALSTRSRNELYSTSADIIRHLRRYGDCTMGDLLRTFIQDVRKAELDEILTTLEAQGSIKKIKADAHTTKYTLTQSEKTKGELSDNHSKEIK